MAMSHARPSTSWLPRRSPQRRLATIVAEPHEVDVPHRHVLTGQRDVQRNPPAGRAAVLNSSHPRARRGGGVWRRLRRELADVPLAAHGLERGSVVLTPVPE